MNHSEKKSKEEFWKEQIARFQQSGQSCKAYCLSENLSYWTFRDQLKKIEVVRDEKLVRIPGKINSQRNNSQSFIEIIISQKISIRIAQGYDAELLRNVINSLGINL